MAKRLAFGLLPKQCWLALEELLSRMKMLRVILIPINKVPLSNHAICMAQALAISRLSLGGGFFVKGLVIDGL
jgi:hypothetical protein